MPDADTDTDTDAPTSGPAHVYLELPPQAFYPAPAKAPAKEEEASDSSEERPAHA